MLINFSQIISNRFAFLSLGISTINPRNYNFAKLIRREWNYILQGNYILTGKVGLDYIKSNFQVKQFYACKHHDEYYAALIALSGCEKLSLGDLEAVFCFLHRASLLHNPYICNCETDIKNIVKEAINTDHNNVLSLCHKFQEILIPDSYDNDKQFAFKNLPDDLKYIFEQTNGKCLYFEQLIDLYSHIFDCSFIEAKKMFLDFNHCIGDESKLLWKKYEQRIKDRKYLDIAKQLKANKYLCRSSQVYALFYAIRLHMCIMES